MGAANVVPGVSGGTVAFITGIYERLLNAIKSFDMHAVSLLRRKRIGDLCKHVDLLFLIVLGFGVIASVFTLAKVLDVALKSYEQQVFGVFFGLIAVSILSVGRMVKKWSIAAVIALLVGLAIAVGLLFVDQATENRATPYLLLCGAVAMCSMIVPGVSGSFVLILLGNYKLIMIDSVNQLRGREWDKCLPILIPVGIGAVLGVAILSRFLSWLFKRFHDAATALITGFVAGSLAIIWPWKRAAETFTKPNGEVKVISYEQYLPQVSDAGFWLTIGAILAGAALMFVMDRLGSKKG